MKSKTQKKTEKTKKKRQKDKTNIKMKNEK